MRFELLVKRCKDPMKWYSSLIGSKVPLLGILSVSGQYKSKEPCGYVNFIDVNDADVVVELEDVEEAEIMVDAIINFMSNLSGDEKQEFLDTIKNKPNSFIQE